MSSKPQITESESRAISAANKVSDKVFIIGIRGYYLDSIGKRGANDRNVYDDAIIVVSPRRFETFRANCDPSVYRKGIASLKIGVHRYYKGKHKGRYWALRLVGEQAAVVRDGQGDSIGIALNIHKGGNRSTGSEGCQTLHPNDWDDFIEIVYDEMKFYGQKSVPYVLIDERMRRRGAYSMSHFPISDNEIDSLLSNIKDSVVEPLSDVPSETLQTPSIPASNPQVEAQPPITKNLPELSLGGYVSKTQESIGTAIETVDNFQVFKDVLDETPRTDGKKSLFATIGNAAYQTAWAVAAFFIGLPMEVWLIVAVIAAVVGVMYLYRQNSLGKIRETARLKFLDIAEWLK